MTQPTAEALRELADRHELAIKLDQTDASFSLSREDMQTIVWALRSAAETALRCTVCGRHLCRVEDCANDECPLLKGVQ
jgi:hypothetical protein